MTYPYLRKASFVLRTRGQDAIFLFLEFTDPLRTQLAVVMQSPMRKNCINGSRTDISAFVHLRYDAVRPKLQSELIPLGDRMITSPRDKGGSERPQSSNPFFFYSPSEECYTVSVPVSSIGREQRNQLQ